MVYLFFYERLERIFKLEDWGCFGLTELAHGSNARALQTTCTFLSKSEGFILNTPNEAAMKFWIGSGYKLANIAIVFARLLVPEQDEKNENQELLKDYGIHPFLVQLRKHPGGGSLLPGIEIGTCGAKIGYKTAENGWFKFNTVNVPYDNWLNKNLDIEALKEEKGKRVVVEKREETAKNANEKIFPPSLPPLVNEKKRRKQLW
jgi:acyl-CoA oxidase